MHARVRALIDELRLEPHPEGGYFREVYRSRSRVQPDDRRTDRAAATSIYFLLDHDQHSCWHRVRSDELWHFYEGDGLEVLLAAPDFDRSDRLLLSAPAGHGAAVQIAPAGWWQAARSTGAYSLVGCTVAPGFEYADFGFLRDDPGGVSRLRRLEPAWADLL